MKRRIAALGLNLLFLPGVIGLGPVARSHAGDAPGPHLPVPSEAHKKWHRAEYKMFVHFGIKTFYPNNNHMGTGKEDPKKFDPAKLDMDQWVRACKAGGFDGIVLTAKHHDGFCNWPTTTTGHSIKSSPWKNGRGDVIMDLKEACRRGGVSFGLYMSFIDENYKHTHGGYKEMEAFQDFYTKQVEELCTRYGPIDEFWFDGFELRQLRGFDFGPSAEIIRKFQPDAVIYDSEAYVQYLSDRCVNWPGGHGGVRHDQEYARKVRGRKDKVWYPNEPSLLFQGNWFYDKHPIKDLRRMKEYYLYTTGHAVTPLQNVAPNQDGLIEEESIERLKEYKAWIDRLHSKESDYAQVTGVTIKADKVRGASKTYAPENLLDNDYDTYYATDDAVKEASIEIDLGAVRHVEGLMIQEYIDLGQRVKEYRVDYEIDGRWQKVFEGKTLGYKRILRGALEGLLVDGKVHFTTRRIRLTVKGDACPLLSTLKVLGSDSGKVLPGLERFEEEDGKFELPVMKAGVRGSGLGGVMVWHGRVEGWKSMDAWVRWLIEVKKPGVFKVIAHQSDDKGGKKYQVVVAGKTIAGEVKPSGGYNSYIDVDLGTIRIDQPGQHHLTVLPVSIEGDLMKLRSIKLIRQ